LKALGKADDRECIRKAIQEFTGFGGRLKKTVKKRAGVRCASCNFLINLDMDNEEREIECPECGARGVLKAVVRDR
jgi:DNA-directed RNA polymerase subunit RPC12/RpoP